MLSDLLDSQVKIPVSPVEKTEDKEIKKKGRLALPKWNLGKIKKLFSRETVDRLEEEGKVILSMVSFFGLLLLFLFELIWKVITKIKPIGKLSERVGKKESKVSKWGERLVAKLESPKGGVRRSFLIALAFRNMRAKRTPSFVTVGGMSVGIGAIVFLVSVGYGLQNLVVSRVARLEELKMADVTQAQTGNVRIDDSAVQTMTNIPGVEEVMPVVSLVGKINFGGGVSESVVYGVTGEYLSAAGLNQVKGEFFESKKQEAYLPDVRVAGVSTEWEWESAYFGKMGRRVAFNIEEGEYLRVRAEPSKDGEIVGYVKRVEGGYEGVETWGESYPDTEAGRAGKTVSGEKLGRWIKAPYPLWEKKGLEYLPMFDSERVQEWREGYVAEIAVEIDEEESKYIQWDDVTNYGAVLGEATASAEVASESATISEAVVEASVESSISATVIEVDASGVEWVTLGDEASGSAEAATVLMIEVPEGNQQEAVVNRAFVELLGLEVDRAVGESFEIGFVILSSLKPDLDRPAESEMSKYVIRAVVEEGNSPLIYVPLSDITALGISNYSQAKLVVKDKGDLSKVRQQVDNLGYKTSSVADTVAQIDKLFGTARAVLATFGLVALVVASLGMFNTLTVSLMERTREVGVMKAMGMQSSEVKELFLAEAMVMGILGGVFGVLVGFVGGKLLGVVLSAFAILKGVGWIDISYIPPLFVVFVLVLSFIVGVVTGIYPARRATKISALDALRYE